MRRVKESYKFSRKESTANRAQDEDNAVVAHQGSEIGSYFAMGSEAGDFVRVSSKTAEGAS
jgi:hypothetical protein